MNVNQHTIIHSHQVKTYFAVAGLMALAAAEVVVLDMNQAESLAGPAGGSDLEDRGAFPAEAR